jgi:hypothetical protein
VSGRHDFDSSIDDSACPGLPPAVLAGWIKGLSEWWEPNAQLTKKDISPHFWPNGTMPNSTEFDALVAEQFDHYRLRVGELVEAPGEFSFSDSRPAEARAGSCVRTACNPSAPVGMSSRPTAITRVRFFPISLATCSFG